MEKLIALIEEKLNAEGKTITAESRFKEDLAADSLDLFELVMALEETYEIEIPSEQLESFTTVGSVAEYLKEHNVEL